MSKKKVKSQRRDSSASLRMTRVLKKFFTSVTPFTRALTLILLIILPILGFKLGQLYQKNIDFRNIPVEFCMRARSAKIIDIRLTDSGKTFNANVGDSIKLNLPSNFTWSVDTGPDDIVDKISDNQYVALKPGTATIQGYGRPACQPGMLCSQLVVNFTATVEIK